MKVNIVAIGSSKGIRIPGAVLDRCGFSATADLAIQQDHLIISPHREIRKGWDEAFRAMSEQKDDRLLQTPSTAFDEAEWTW